MNTFHQYSDPLNAQWVSQLGRHVRAAGIYSGGQLSVSGLNVTVWPAKFEISDQGSATDPLAGSSAVANVGTNPATLWEDRLTAESTASAVVTVPASKISYITITWSRDAGASATPVIGSQLTSVALNPNTLVLGTIETGASGVTGTGLTYTGRTQADLPQVHFAVHAPSKGSLSDLQVFVNGGRSVVSGVPTNVLAGPVVLTTAPTNSGYRRLDLIYMTTAGAFAKVDGTAVNSSTAPTLPTNPGGTPLASVLVTQGNTAVVESMITDLRPFFGSGGALSTPVHTLTAASPLPSGCTAASAGTCSNSLIFRLSGGGMIQSGKAVPDSGTWANNKSAKIVFGVPFTSAPNVVITPGYAGGSDNGVMGTLSPTTTGFTWIVGTAGVQGFMWTATGV